MAAATSIPFGSGFVEAELPEDTFFASSLGGGGHAVPITDLEAALRTALATPLDSPPIESLVGAGSRVVIAFDDLTVPSFGSVRRLSIVACLEALARAGVADADIRFICANALHRKFPREELALVLGDDLVMQMGERLSCHDAEDAANIVSLGQTPEGYDVELNRAAAEADLTIYVNSASYRGFAGGWKSVCVGLSTFKSIRHHHHPDGMSMSVDNNPMHQVLDRMGALTEAALPGNLFKIDAVEAGPFATAFVAAGSTNACRAAVLEKLRSYYPPRRDATTDRFDVILYGVPDWSPYAIFATMNPILTLISSGLGYLGGTIQALGKPGCTVIMATPCPLQWDDVHHPSYRDVWENVLCETRDPYEIEKQYTDHYATHPEYIDKYRNAFAFHPVHGVLGTHPLRRLKHCGRVIVAGIEEPAVAAHLGFEAADSVATALAMAAEEHGAGYRLAYAEHPAAPTKVNM